MAPLLRPSECSVLIVDALNSQDSEFTVHPALKEVLQLSAERIVVTFHDGRVRSNVLCNLKEVLGCHR